MTAFPHRFLPCVASAIQSRGGTVDYHATGVYWPVRGHSMTTFKLQSLLSAVVLGALACAAPALAADLPVKAVPVVSSVYNWTGIYGGVHVGYGQGMKDWLDETFDYKVKGFLGG